MNAVVEQRVLTRPEIAEDIACHLMVRQTLGKAMVIVDSPRTVLSSVRRQWMKLGRALQRERSRTLDQRLIRELTRQLEDIQHLHFVAKSPREVPEADVFFVTTDVARSFLKECRTVYWYVHEENAPLHQLSADAVMVAYEEKI